MPASANLNMNTLLFFIIASRVKQNYQIIGRMKFETKLADVGINTYCNIYY